MSDSPKGSIDSFFMINDDPGEALDETGDRPDLEEVDEEPDLVRIGSPDRKNSIESIGTIKELQGEIDKLLAPLSDCVEDAYKSPLGSADEQRCGSINVPSL